MSVAPMRWAFVVSSVPFTQAVIDGQSSLGGSESACLGLARALVTRGHDVHVFVDKLQAPAQIDAHGLKWHPLADLKGPYSHTMWDVFVALRMPGIFAYPIQARYRILWNQDMLEGSGSFVDIPPSIMSLLWQVDRIAYVSAYHRAQWEALLPDASSLGWVTRNSYDPAHLPADSAWPEKDPYRVIYISRPERGLAPLLTMWPALRQRHPQATLGICRYQSMYDGEGTSVQAMVNEFDRVVAEVNAEVGGIEWLGTLAKPDLYREIAKAAVMWYPGVPDFAETSCIAAIEAQACGTPLVCSFKGALPETAPYALHIDGDANTDAYRTLSVAAVSRLLGPDGITSAPYRYMVERGREHVRDYTHGEVAAYWEHAVLDAFDARATPHKVLTALLFEDDHMAARELIWRDGIEGTGELAVHGADLERCNCVISGHDQSPDDYSGRALADPIDEGDRATRMTAVAEQFAGCTDILDLACGNGAFALKIARLRDDVTVTGWDYAQTNVERATEAAKRIGVSDRVSFACVNLYDYATHTPTLPEVSEPYDGVFLGEILEHLANAHGMLDAAERLVKSGGRVVFTVPHGPFSDMRPRLERTHRGGHVHHFQMDDLTHMLRDKAHLQLSVLHIDAGTFRGYQAGHWLVSYTTSGAATYPRDLQTRIERIRPASTLSVGLITKNAASDLRRCLESVWMIADEIVVGDTGSTDDTIAIAESYGARVLRLPDVTTLDHGFAEARNRVLDACTGDWFLWIDADEVLHGSQHVHALIETGPFEGYAMQQRHLMADTPNTHDTPVRLFKRHPLRTFYGAVHEQPQHGNANQDITPALQLHEVAILHYGYPTDAVRRGKASRNRPLIVRNHEVCPERDLNGVIDMRECVQMALDEVAVHKHMTPDAQSLLKHCVDIYEQKVCADGTRIADPVNKFHELARPFYDMALEHHDLAWEFGFALAGQLGSLKGTPRIKQFRVRTYEQLEREVLGELAKARKRMVQDPPMTAPVVGCPAEIELGAEVCA